MVFDVIPLAVLSLVHWEMKQFVQMS